MTISGWIRWVGMFAALVILTAAPVRADSIAITAGTVAVVNGLDLPGFALTGPGSSFTGILPVGGANCCAFAPGDTVQLDRSFTLTSLPGQPTAQSVAGTSFSSTFVLGSLAFTTVPFVVPTGAGPTFSFSTPFVATGQIAGFADLAHTVQVFSTDLTGIGVATVSGRVAAPTLLVGSALSFAFSPADASPTPEPMSALLLGTGLAGLAVWRRRRA